jgi:2-(1,2-epoxy-1,2-dihydrophenyl)acetyl-CoA isomerase
MAPIKLFFEKDGDEHSVEYETKEISYELLENGTAICTYNTPKSLNALTTAQQWDTFAILAHVYRDDAVRCLIWTGAGRAFGAGAAMGPQDKATEIPGHIQESMIAAGFGPDGTLVLKAFTLKFWDLPKPSIVAVNGLAVGGAANIALVNFHDMVVCSTEAKFKYPFAQLGT